MYAIPDEPDPGRFRGFAVHPQWPLLSSMVCGAWLAWPWMLLNGIALGTPTRRRETLTIAGGLLATIGLAWLLLWLIDREILASPLAIRLALLAFVAFKLAVSYSVVLHQARSFNTYEYYGGKSRSGWVVVLLGVFVRPVIVGLSDSILWKLVVSGGWFLLL